MKTKILNSTFLLCIIISLIFLFSCSQTNNSTNISDTETALEHSHDYILSNTIDATCTMPGVDSYICSCGASYDEAIAPTGHDSNISFSYDLSTHFYICLTCGERTEEKEHIYSQRATAPSCDINGYYLYFCICGFEYKEPIISTGHSYDEISISFDEEFHYNICTVCGETKKSSHTFGAWNTKTEPKCEQEGSKERTCDYCEYSETDKISALTHSFSDKNVCIWCNSLNDCSTFSFKLIDSSYYSITKIDTSTEAYVVIPQAYNNIPVKEISEYAFSDHAEIIGVYIPPTIEIVGKNAFSGCTNLKEVYYLGCIETWCCIDFSNVNSNPMNYGERFFIDFSETTEITLPNSVNALKNYSFYGFDNIEALTIPSTLTKFNDTTFENCYSLRDVYYQGTLKDWNNIAFNDYDSSPMYVAKNLYINNSLLEHLNVRDIDKINNFAFSGVDSLKTVNIEDGVFTIGVRAFYNCTSLYKVTIGNDVQTISDFAFYDCSNLISLTLGKNVFEINDRAFQRCYKLLEIYNLSELSIEKNSQNGYVAYYSKVIHTDSTSTSLVDCSIENYLFGVIDGTNYLLSYIGNDAIISLPVDYYDNSYSIYEYAFYKNKYIESITISKNIDSILPFSFRYCDCLKTVIFTDRTNWSIVTSELTVEELTNSTLMVDYLSKEYYNRTWTKIKAED